MSIRHPEFTELIEGLAAGDSLDHAGRELLEEYASDGDGIEDQLGRTTRESVERLTGSEDVRTPRRAAKALLLAA